MLSDKRGFECDQTGKLGRKVDSGVDVQSITDDSGNDGLHQLDGDPKLGKKLDNGDYRISL